jgi:thiol:disulfide interchange protein
MKSYIEVPESPQEDAALLIKVANLNKGDVIRALATAAENANYNCTWKLWLQMSIFVSVIFILGFVFGRYSIFGMFMSFFQIILKMFTRFDQKKSPVSDLI